MPTKHNYGKVLSAIITPPSKAINAVGVVFLVFMMLLTTADVILRAFFNIAKLSPYTFEAVEFMMVLLVFFGLSYCELQKGHINVDLIVTRLPVKLRVVIDSVTYVLSIGFVVLLIWRSVAQALFVHDAGTRATALGIPIYWFLIVIAFGSFMLCLSLISNMILNITGNK